VAGKPDFAPRQSVEVMLGKKVENCLKPVTDKYLRLDEEQR
jgi:hypothetical protein